MTHLDRRTLLAGAGLAAAAGTLPATPADAAGPRGRRRDRRPNLVVILGDDLGYGALGAYGQQTIQTPHLDRLAREGIRFTNGYSGASVCAPSRTTLLTGMHGGHARVRANDFRTTGQQPRLLPEDTTIAQVLDAAGYATGVFGKWGFGDDDYYVPTPLGATCEVHLPTTPSDARFTVANRRDPSHPLQKGFGDFQGIIRTDNAFDYWPDYLWHDNRRQRLSGNEGEGRGTYAPEVYLASALDFIDEHADEPFFLYLAPQLVHFPTQVPDHALAPYADQPWSDDMRAYAAQYTLLDDHVGQVIARLKAHGLADDTLVLFTGDNGPTWAEHLLAGSSQCTDVESPSPTSALADQLWDTNGGLRAGKHSLYEGGIRVPLIAWGPGIVRDDVETVADRPWGSVDFLSTLADFAGVTPPSDVDGISVRSWITGEQGSTAHPPLYFERPPNRDQNVDGGPPPQLVYTTAIREGRWKAVRFAPGTDPSIPDARAVLQLFDLESDRAETTDVSHLHPDVAARLARQLRRHHAPPPYRRAPYRPRRTGRAWTGRRRRS